MTDIAKTIDCVKKQISLDNAQRDEKKRLLPFHCYGDQFFQIKHRAKQMQVNTQIIP